MNIAQWLSRAAREHGDNPAIFSGKKQYGTYKDLNITVGQVSNWLKSLGIKPGDRVAIFMVNQTDYLCLLFGIWCSGAVAVPINAKLHVREVTWIVENAEAKLTLASGQQFENLQRVTGFWNANSKLIDFCDETMLGISKNLPCEPVSRRESSDLAWLFYTSGTTGRPKGVMITHGMLKSMAFSYFIDVDEVRQEDAAIYSAPFSHGAGLYSIMHVLKAARHVFPRSGGFSPKEVLDLSEHFQSAHMFAAPTMVKRLTAASKASGRVPKGIRTIVYAGGPMYKSDIIEAVDWFGPVFVQIYGQGECPMAITALSRKAVSDRTHPRWEERLTSVGSAQSVVEVQIGDPSGKPTEEGQIGEIMVRGDPVMPGYWRNSDASEKALAQGWLHTGDIGYMDHEGYITLKDRSNDLIISGGSNIYPREVEEVLLMHPCIIEAAVIGRYHPDWGEEVIAFIVLRDQIKISSAEIGEFCQRHIAAYKRPKGYITLKVLPKNNYGKILKTELRILVETSPLLG